MIRRIHGARSTANGARHDRTDGVGAIDGDDLQRRHGIDEFVGGSVPAARNNSSDVRPDARQ